jgi:hypothetical protein
MLRFLVRISIWLLRLDQITRSCIVNFFGFFDNAVVAWVRSNADRMVWVIGWCVGELVTISIFDAVFWGVVFFLVGPLRRNRETIWISRVDQASYCFREEYCDRAMEVFPWTNAVSKHLESRDALLLH